MRKSLLLTIILLIFAISSAVFLGKDLNRNVENVKIKELRHVGDYEAVSDIKLDANYVLYAQNNVYWYCSIMPGKSPSITSLLSFKEPNIFEEDVHYSPNYDFNLFQKLFNSPENEFSSDFYATKTYMQSIDDDLYFTFDTHTENGTSVNLTNLSDGYGIYKFSMNQGIGTADKISYISNLYPLDPAIKICDFAIDKKNSILCLSYVNNDNLYLDIIDLTSGNLKKELKIMSFEKGPVHNKILFYDNFLLLSTICSNDPHMLTVINYEGTDPYQLMFTCASGNYTELSSQSSACFEKGRLVISGPHMKQRITVLDPSSSEQASSNVIRVNVYDETGLLFSGDYECSLTPDSIRKTCGRHQIHLEYVSPSMTN